MAERDCCNDNPPAVAKVSIAKIGVPTGVEVEHCKYDLSSGTKVSIATTVFVPGRKRAS